MNNLFDETIVLRKKYNSKTDKTQAIRNGSYVVAKKTNPLHSKNYKLDNETEELKHNKIEMSVSKLISQARINKGYNQKQLANLINVDAKTINNYENGRAIPDHKILNKLEKYLHVSLRGKK